MSEAIKLSSPATKEFWEIPIAYEDEHLLALNKPACLLSSPDRHDPSRPNLLQLLHREMKRGVEWSKERQLHYLMLAHRLDFETSGLILLAKTKPVLVALANLFGSEKPNRIYVALVRGTPSEERFVMKERIALHPLKPGFARVDSRLGKRTQTEFVVRERFRRCTLLECHPLTGRLHQIRVHLSYAHFPILGDTAYGGQPLLLSHLKANFRLKPGKKERPLISTAAIHAEQLHFIHPVTKQEIKIAAAWPKDLTVAMKYLRRYAPARPLPVETESLQDEMPPEDQD